MKRIFIGISHLRFSPPAFELTIPELTVIEMGQGIREGQILLWEEVGKGRQSLLWKGRKSPEKDI